MSVRSSSNVLVLGSDFPIDGTYSQAYSHKVYCLPPKSEADNYTNFEFCELQSMAFLCECAKVDYSYYNIVSLLNMHEQVDLLVS